MEVMDTAPQTSAFKERLVPGPGLFIALFLLVPAVALVTTAFDTALALPMGLIVYALVMTILCLMSPVIKVEEGVLSAGRARIPVSELGDVRLLGNAALKNVLGEGGDARNYLVIRGWIHTGVLLRIADPADPTPNWVLTTRRPQALADTIEAQR